MEVRQKRIKKKENKRKRKREENIKEIMNWNIKIGTELDIEMRIYF